MRILPSHSWRNLLCGGKSPAPRSSAIAAAARKLRRNLVHCSHGALPLTRKLDASCICIRSIATERQETSPTQIGSAVIFKLTALPICTITAPRTSPGRSPGGSKFLQLREGRYEFSQSRPVQRHRRGARVEQCHRRRRCPRRTGRRCRGHADAGEIQVTATKRETPLQKTPIAVSAINANTLDKQRVTNVVDITSLVPSLAATTQGDHGVVTLTMRGIGNDSAKTEYADPEVALFVDGVYAPRAEAAAGLLLDLDSIEALRGPQGTLWGRNSTVGRDQFPDGQAATRQDVRLRPDVGVSATTTTGPRAAVNVPVSDTFAFRVAVAEQQHDGYVDYQSPNGQLPSVESQQAAYLASGGTLDTFHAIDPNNYTTSGPKYSSQDQSGARISTLWTPTETLSWNLSLEYFRDRGTPLANLMQTPRPGQDFWSILADAPAKLERDGYALRSRVDWDVNESMMLSYIAGFSKFDGSGDFDQDGGVQVPTSFATGSTFQDDRTNYEHFKSMSHELNLKSVGEETSTGSSASYYALEDNSIRFDIPIFNGTAARHRRVAGLLHTAQGNGGFLRGFRTGDLAHLRPLAPHRRRPLHARQEGKHRWPWLGLGLQPGCAADSRSHPAPSPVPALASASAQRDQRRQVRREQADLVRCAWTPMSASTRSSTAASRPVTNPVACRMVAHRTRARP